MLISKDLLGIRYSLNIINNIESETLILFKSIYDELKIDSPHILPLLTIPLSVDLKN